MNKLEQLIGWQNELRKGFGKVKMFSDQRDYELAHLGKLTEIVSRLITNTIDQHDMVFEKHLETLDTTEIQQHDGSSRPMVKNVAHWRALGRTPKAGNRIDLSQVPMHKIKFWSDLHFFQEKIIEYTKRPFANAEEMNAKLLQNYNAVVDDDDVVIWVGDITMAGRGKSNELLDQFKGYKIQVVGNHDIDRFDGKLVPLNFDEVHTSILLHNMVITHHPWREQLPEGMWNIHGHIHNLVLDYPRHINVSCEVLDYAPCSLAELLAQTDYWKIKL